MNKIYGFAALACLCIPITTFAQAETLTYQGDPFNQVTLSGNITIAEANTPSSDYGTVVLSSPLGDNLNDVVVVPESYSFDSGTMIGALYLNSASPFSSGPGDSATFEFFTNAQGQITQGIVSIQGGIFGGTNSPSSAALTLGPLGDTFSAGFSSPSCGAPPPAGISCFGVSESNIGFNGPAPGNWSETVAPAPEIDPNSAASALTLLAICFALLRARRYSQI